MYHLYKPPRRNLVQKHKTIKFDVVEEQPATMYIQISWKKTKKIVENCIPSNYRPCFLKLSKWNCTNHSIFWPEFPDFPCSFYPIFNGIALHFVGSVFDSEDDLSLGADAQGFSTSSPPHFSPASSSISTGQVTERLHVRPPPISNHSQEGGGGGTPHMKWVGMLVVLLRAVNFGFWSHLGWSGQNAIIFSREGLV